MNKLTTIVPNSRPAYVAEAITNENDSVDDVILIPIVAWQIESYSEKDNENLCAQPITTELGLPDNYAIYYSDTKVWSVPLDSWGSGLSDLIKHFQKLKDK